MTRNNLGKRMVILTVAVGLLVSLSASSASALPVTDKLKKQAQKNTGIGSFSVQGTRIIGPNGKVFVPRGVAKGGLEYTPKGYEEKFYTYQKMKSWGINVVRVPVSAAFGLKRMCTYNKNYMALVDKITRWGEQLQMLILLDNHMSTQGATCGTGKWVGPQKAPDVHSLDFAKQLATRYKDNPYVAIDLYNEPHDIPDSIWRNGGIVDGWRAVGMQQMLDAVRSTGNNNLVVATGNLWGNDLRMVVNSPLFNDKNVLYGAHSYPFWCGRVIYYEEAYNCNGSQLPPHMEGQIGPAVGKRPIILSEFGTQRSHPGEMQAPIDWAESRGIGWIAWLWCNSKMTDFCLMNPDGSPSVSGKQVKQSIARATKK